MMTPYCPLLLWDLFALLKVHLRWQQEVLPSHRPQHRCSSLLRHYRLHCDQRPVYQRWMKWGWSLDRLADHWLPQAPCSDQQRRSRRQPDRSPMPKQRPQPRRVLAPARPGLPVRREHAQAVVRVRLACGAKYWSICAPEQLEQQVQALKEPIRLAQLRCCSGSMVPLLMHSVRAQLRLATLHSPCVAVRWIVLRVLVPRGSPPRRYSTTRRAYQQAATLLPATTTRAKPRACRASR